MARHQIMMRIDYSYVGKKDSNHLTKEARIAGLCGGETDGFQNQQKKVCACRVFARVRYDGKRFRSFA
jgi:hypothetical protein